MSEQNHRPGIYIVEGDVIVSLPDDQYMRMSPEMARNFAGRLVREAAKAEGQRIDQFILSVPAQEPERPKRPGLRRSALTGRYIIEGKEEQG